MAYSFVHYTSTGVSVPRTIPFDFIDEEDVVVTLNGVVTTAYTIAGSTLTYTSVPANGVVEKIARASGIDERLVDWADGDVVSANTLDVDGNQAFFLAQELADVTERSLRVPAAENPTVAAVTMPAVADRASKFAAWDASGNIIATDAAIGGATVSAFGETLIDDANAAAARTTIGISAAMDPVVTAATLAAGRAAMGPWGDALVTATGSTTARTLATRTAEVLNVKDFGATGDGSTDDKTAIQAALTAVPAEGGVVFFPMGTYKVTGFLTVKSKTTIAGAGRDCSKLIITNPTSRAGVVPGACPIFSIEDISDVVVRDLTLDGGVGTNATSEGMPLFIDNCTNVSVQNCTLQNGRESCCAVGSYAKVHNLKVSGCTFALTAVTLLADTYCSMLVPTSGSRVVVTGCDFHVADAVADSVKTLSVGGLNSEAWGGGAGSLAAADVDDMAVTGCNFYRCQIQSYSGTLDRLAVSACNIVGGQIRLRGTIGLASISACTIDCDGQADFTHGILADHFVGQLTISACNIYDADENGIEISWASSAGDPDQTLFTISGCTILGCDDAGIEISGQEIRAGTITGCTISGCAKGIYATSTVNLNIQGNRVVSNTANYDVTGATSSSIETSVLHATAANFPSGYRKEITDVQVTSAGATTVFAIPSGASGTVRVFSGMDNNNANATYCATVAFSRAGLATAVTAITEDVSAANAATTVSTNNIQVQASTADLTRVVVIAEYAKR